MFSKPDLSNLNCVHYHSKYVDKRMADTQTSESEKLLAHSHPTSHTCVLCVCVCTEADTVHAVYGTDLIDHAHDLGDDSPEGTSHTCSLVFRVCGWCIFLCGVGRNCMFLCVRH